MDWNSLLFHNIFKHSYLVSNSPRRFYVVCFSVRRRFEHRTGSSQGIDLGVTGCRRLELDLAQAQLASCIRLVGPAMSSHQQALLTGWPGGRQWPDSAIRAGLLRAQFLHGRLLGDLFIHKHAMTGAALLDLTRLATAVTANALGRASCISSWPSDTVQITGPN